MKRLEKLFDLTQQYKPMSTVIGDVEQLEHIFVNTQSKLLKQQIENITQGGVDGADAYALKQLQ